MISKSTLIVLAVLAVCIVAQSHNYEWGSRTRNDTLILNKFVTKDGSWMQKVTVDIHYPNQTVSLFLLLSFLKYLPILFLQNVYPPPNKTINYIRVLDQLTDGSGGTAELKYGGVGYKTVGIHLKSQRSKGIKSIVEIYGF